MAPMAFAGPEAVAHDSTLTVAGAGLDHFGILQSAMFTAWLRAVGGRIKGDPRISAELVYNTFPWPEPGARGAVERAARGVLAARARHAPRPLGRLYDPAAMPADLAAAHDALDAAVDALFAPAPLDDAAPPRAPARALRAPGGRAGLRRAGRLRTGVSGPPVAGPSPRAATVGGRALPPLLRAGPRAPRRRAGPRARRRGAPAPRRRARRGAALLRARPDPRLRVDALGLSFPSPLGVAAGMDKDATWFEGLGALGFGFVEVGTVTARPQAGNPRPRVHRLLADRGLLNSMGFPNAGAAADGRAAAARSGAGRSWPRTSASRATRRSTTPAPTTARRSGTWRRPATSSSSTSARPNTPGLRDMQAVERLGALVDDVRAELAARGVARPLLVKLSPDLDDEAIDAIADLALERGLDGLVAVNTTVARDGLASPPELLARPGGVSGPPLEAARAGRAAAPARAGRRPARARLRRRRRERGRRVGADRRRRDARAGLHRLRLRRPAVAAAGERRARPRASRAAGAPTIQALVGSEAPAPVP